jgi:GMP synthase-like glutamine amidotransferase
MRVLIFQHLAVEHPRIRRNFLAADGHITETVELDEGDAIPPLASFDALWVMGGPMDTWEEAEYPRLAADKAAIRETVGVRRLPFLGFCLGRNFSL